MIAASISGSTAPLEQPKHSEPQILVHSGELPEAADALKDKLGLVLDS